MPARDEEAPPDPDDAFLSPCDVDLLGGDAPLADDEGDLFALFAEALDPGSPKTVMQAEAEWRELLG